LGAALGEAMRAHGWVLGRDVAVAISADAIHYGPDFNEVPFGLGGVEAYQQAVARDRAILRGPLTGPATVDKAHQLYAGFVDPEHPDTYRITWCGRFSIPFGMLLLRELAERTGAGFAVGHPVAYATSVGWPELALREVGLGATAPANLYHFVGYPAVAFTLAAPSR
jgi:MEMO1 family protein